MKFSKSPTKQQEKERTFKKTKSSRNQQPGDIQQITDQASRTANDIPKNKPPRNQKPCGIQQITDQASRKRKDIPEKQTTKKPTTW